MGKQHWYDLFSNSPYRRMDAVRRTSNERLLLWMYRLESDSSVASQAVKGIKRNQRALIRMARGKGNPEEVRLSALANIANPELRDAIVRSTLQWVTDPRTRNGNNSFYHLNSWVGCLSSQEKILELGRTTASLEILAAAIDNLHTPGQEQQELILELIAKAESGKMRAEYIGMLDESHQEKLVEIATREEDVDACTQAFARIGDQAVQLDIYEKRASYIRMDDSIQRRLIQAAFEQGHYETGVELLLPGIPETNSQSPDKEGTQTRRIPGKWADDEDFYRFLEHTPIDPDKMRQCIRFLWVQALDCTYRTVRRNGFSACEQVLKEEAFRLHVQSFPQGTFPPPLMINLLLMIDAAKPPDHIWTYTNDGDEEFEQQSPYCYNDIRPYLRSLIPKGSRRVPSYPYLLREPAGTPAGV